VPPNVEPGELIVVHHGSVGATLIGRCDRQARGLPAWKTDLYEEANRGDGCAVLRAGRPEEWGQTLKQTDLRGALQRLGQSVADEDVLIHNPRLISTALFVGRSHRASIARRRADPNVVTRVRGTRCAPFAPFHRMLYRGVCC
jgi:hypothetical protein